MDNDEEVKVTEEEMDEIGYVPKTKIGEVFDGISKIVSDAMPEKPTYDPEKPLSRQLTETLHKVDLSADFNERGQIRPHDFVDRAEVEPETERVTSSSSSELKENLKKRFYPEEVVQNE